MQAFKEGASYYEVFFNSRRRLRRESKLLLPLLHETRDRRVLDLACGTGLHAQFIAERHTDVWANDISPEMIAHARRVRPHPRIQYAVHDMREPLADTFDLALCLGNSLSLLGSQEELNLTLANVAGALSGDGVFLLQVLNYAHPKNQEARCRVEERRIDGTDLVAVKCLAPRGKYTYLTLNYFTVGGEAHAAVAESAVLRNLSLGHLNTAINGAGLSIVETLGSFDGHDYDPATSDDLILVCALQTMNQRPRIPISA
jgi:SAM-dependent methyltransferase